MCVDVPFVFRQECAKCVWGVGVGLGGWEVDGTGNQLNQKSITWVFVITPLAKYGQKALNEVLNDSVKE